MTGKLSKNKIFLVKESKSDFKLWNLKFNDFFIFFYFRADLADEIVVTGVPTI